MRNEFLFRSKCQRFWAKPARKTMLIAIVLSLLSSKEHDKMLARRRAYSVLPLPAKSFMKLTPSVCFTDNEHVPSFQNHIACLPSHHRDIRLITGQKAKKQGITGIDRKIARDSVALTRLVWGFFQAKRDRHSEMCENQRACPKEAKCMCTRFWGRCQSRMLALRLTALGDTFQRSLTNWPSHDVRSLAFPGTSLRYHALLSANSSPAFPGKTPEMTVAS